MRTVSYGRSTVKLPGKGYPWKQFALDLKSAYKADHINDAAAALTYYGVLALFPFLLFLVSLATLVIDPSQAERMVQQASQVLPEQAGEIISERVHSLMANRSVGLLSVGALGALWAASSGVAALIRALNTTYDVEESRPFWKVRGLALLFTIGGGLLAVLAALTMVALPALANRIGGPVATAILLLRFPVAAALMMAVWAVAYYALPDVEQRFRFISPGSVLGVVIWLVASVGFSIYVRNFGKYDATYGSLGGVIVMLLWMWISAQVLLVGAEINSIIEHASPEGKNEGERTLEGAQARTAGGSSSDTAKDPARSPRRRGERSRNVARVRRKRAP
ncbi:MAG: YihY/virulence factor BrkB family protein [Myxococcaceae bacterium]|nr:YihY/virulence factor BrkB family protein [Myxococcaceae bacterium]